MNRYSAISALGLKNSLPAGLATWLLAVYYFLLMLPNIHLPLNNIAFLYISIQLLVVYSVLIPLLMHWQYCPILRLVPHYNRMMKKLLVIIFTLFMVVPTLLAWARGYDIWLLQTLTLLLWNIYGFMIFRRLFFNDPTLEPEEKYNQIHGYLMITCVAIMVIHNTLDWRTELGFLTTNLQILIVALSMLIWLLPKKTGRKKSISLQKLQPKRFSLDAFILVPKQTKLVWGILSNNSISSLLVYPLTLIPTMIFLNHYLSTNVDFILISCIGIPSQLRQLLKQKERLSTLIFWLNGSTAVIGEVVYRAFFNISLYCSVIIVLLCSIASYWALLDYTLLKLLLFLLLPLCSLYFILVLPFPLYIVVFIPILVMALAISDEYIEWLYIALFMFVAWTYRYPPNKWFKAQMRHKAEVKTPEYRTS